MKKVNQFQDALKKVQGIAESLITEQGKEILSQKKSKFEEELQSAQYVKVPLVGSFSAGKSSLLNMFTQKRGMLPVDTMPETAVAYELYYDENERVVLYRDGAEIETQTLANIKSLETNPGDIAKVYCNSATVKDLCERNIILVDMPGIGSGIERHDAAVQNYIYNGSAFVLMMDVEQGNLRQSTITFLEELKYYNLNPLVLVSKIDKKPEDEVEEIVGYIEEQLKNILENAPSVGTVCAVNNQFEDFQHFLDSLDADSILDKKMGGRFVAIVEGVKQELATRIEVREQDIADIDGNISQVEKSIAQLKKEEANYNPTEELKSPEEQTEKILQDIKEALVGKIPTLTQMIQKGESFEELQAVMMSTIRLSISESLTSLNKDYTITYAVELRKISEGLKSIKVDVPELVTNIQDMVLDIILDLLPKKYKVYATILRPYIGKAIEWVTKVFLGWDVADRVKQEFANIIIPELLSSLKESIMQAVEESQEQLRKDLISQYMNNHQQVLSGLLEKKEDAVKSKEMVSEEIGRLRAAIEELNHILAV